jgi:putative endonuclease
MYFVYILLCSDNSLYTGISNNPDQRLKDHKSGKGGRYTRLHKPVERVYLEKIGSRSDALKRELQIKSWTRDKKIRILKLEISKYLT